LNGNIEKIKKDGLLMHERNIVWQNGKVSYENKCKLMGQKGLAVWFTGLSGAIVL